MNLFLFFVSTLGLLVTIIVIRTFLFKPKKTNSNALHTLPKVNIDQAAEHLSQAIQCKSISTPDDNQENAMSFQGEHNLVKIYH